MTKLFDSINQKIVKREIVSRHLPNADFNTAGGVIRKTGITTLLGISLAASHLFLIFVFPEKKKTEIFYIVRVTMISVIHKKPVNVITLVGKGQSDKINQMITIIDEIY